MEISQTPRVHPFWVLAIGVFAVSTAAILIRVAQSESVPSLTIAAGRLVVAAVVLTPMVFPKYTGQLRQLSRRDALLCLVSGVVLGGHFAAWITSLEYTSVVASVVLVTTNPLWVALLSFPLLGERVTRPVMLGILLAFAGGVIVAAGGDAGQAPTRADPLWGNFLATVGAIAVALYMMIGRRLRGKLSLVPYIWAVYGTAALTMAVVVASIGESVVGYSWQGYAALLALGLFPQLIGHSSFNYALGYLPAAFVSLVVLGEPIGSTVLAAIFLSEVPDVLSVVGSAIILMGIFVASRKPARKKPPYAELPHGNV